MHAVLINTEMAISNFRCFGVYRVEYGVIKEIRSMINGDATTELSSGGANSGADEVIKIRNVMKRFFYQPEQIVMGTLLAQ